MADDEDDIRSFLREILTREGFEVIESSDRCSSYEMATQEKPDIIMLDLNMPRMDGLEVLKRLKKNEATKSIPVLMLTGRRLPKYEIESLRSGAIDYITKPFLSAEVRDRVKLALYQSESR